MEAAAGAAAAGAAAAAPPSFAAGAAAGAPSAAGVAGASSLASGFAAGPSFTPPYPSEYQPLPFNRKDVRLMIFRTVCLPQLGQVSGCGSDIFIVCEKTLLHVSH